MAGQGVQIAITELVQLVPTLVPPPRRRNDIHEVHLKLFLAGQKSTEKSGSPDLQSVGPLRTWSCGGWRSKDLLRAVRHEMQTERGKDPQRCASECEQSAFPDSGWNEMCSTAIALPLPHRGTADLQRHALQTRYMSSGPHGVKRSTSLSPETSETVSCQLQRKPQRLHRSESQSIHRQTPKDLL